jgi:hypothetical protein
MSDPIAAGREAWQQVHRATSFESWKKIAVAVQIGRQHSLRSGRIPPKVKTAPVKAVLASRSASEGLAGIF